MAIRAPDGANKKLDLYQTSAKTAWATIMSQDDLGGPEIGKYMLQGLFCVCQNDAE